MTDHIDTATERAKLAGLTGFTPGPWEFIDGEYGYSCLDSDRNGEVLSMGGRNDGDYPIVWMGEDASHQDLRLIAAAPDLLAMAHSLLDALDAERKRAEKAEAERDQALARAAAAAMVMRERCAKWHDEVVAHDQSGIDYSDAVGITISNRYELEQSVKAHEYSAREIRAIALDPDAEAALQRVVDAARLEGWRAGRDAATEPLTSLAAVLRKSENSYHQSQASAMLERAAAIRALPEPKEASHE